MKLRIAWLLPFLIAGCLIPGCTPKARYERMLKHELANGIRHDSLFMGLYLGMPEKDFYTHCWNLNKKGLIRQGEGNVSVEYKMKDELKYPAIMNFYPAFSEGKISEMPVKYKYSGWGPGNKTLSSESLQLDILRYYEKIYGGGFLAAKNRLYGNAYVKIDGNRRISIYKNDDLYVYAVFTDMLAKKDTLASPSALNVNDSTKTQGKTKNEQNKPVK
jgi:hypothetical protein